MHTQSLTFSAVLYIAAHIIQAWNDREGEEGRLHAERLEKNLEGT